MKSLLRKTVANALFLGGVLQAAVNVRLRRSAVVLMYHRVLPREEIPRSPSQPGIIVSSRGFERQMRWLAKRLDMITLDRFIEHLRTGAPFRARTGLVTFDDGWRDNYLHALPIARRHAVPLAVFLPVAFIGTRRRFWQERMVGLIRQIRGRADRTRAVLSDAHSDPVLTRLEPCPAVGRKRLDMEIGRFLAGMKEAGAEAVDATLDKMSEVAGLDPSAEVAEPDFLSWEEVAEMKARGVSFGSHGMSHRILTREGTDMAEELHGSKAVLQERLDHAVRALAYPNGNFNEEVVHGAREAGFEVAFSTTRGYVAPHDDRYALRRVNMHEDMTGTLPMFLARLIGLW